MNLLNSFKYAIRGVLNATQGQRNIKIHWLAAGMIVMVGFYLDFNYVDWCIAVIMIGVVISAEVFNTAIEAIVNFISPEKKIEAGRIKDLSAGAVLLVSVGALFVGVLLVSSKLILE